MPMPLTAGQRTLPTQRAAEAPPADPGSFLDQMGDAFTVARADTSNYLVDTRHDAYRPLMDAMVERGHDVAKWVNPARGTLAYENFYAAVLQEKAKGGGFEGLPATYEEFEQQWRDKDATRVREAMARNANADLFPSLLGGLGGAMSDPANIYTLPFGGFGKTLTQRILTEGLVGAGVELGMLPGAQRNREELGLPDLTGEEAGLNVAFGGFGAAAFRGGIEVAPTAARKLGENIAGDWQRTRDYIWPRLPQAVRDRFGSKEALQPDHLPDVAEEVIGRDSMTQAERDAADIMRDEQEVARSPFVPNGAGQQLHNDMVGAAIDALIDLPPPTTLPVRSAAGGSAEVRPSSRAGRATGSNAFGDATAEARFMGRVRRAESSGNDAAKNPRSSATGRYQFIDSTWIAQYVKRYGRGGLSDAQILAKRGNGALQDQLMRDLTAENAAFLRSQGEAVTEGNLYLVHFSGPGGARKVFAADPNARIESVWSAEVIAANPFLKGMTAGDVISWAHRKMGQKGNPPRSGEGYQLTEEATGIDSALAREAEELETIRRALDEAYTAEDAARRAAQGEQDSDPVLAALDAEPSPASFREFIEAQDQLDEAANPPREPLDAGDSAEQAALRSSLADVAHDTKDSLNDIAALARRFEASEDEVRAALDGMVARGTLTQNRKTGNYMRKPGSDPDELLETVARHGGLRDDEGHGLGLKGLSQTEQRELISGAKRNTLRNRAARGSRDWNKIMTRAGPLLRHEGRSLDEIGEALWEEGWFTERPDTAQVLDLLEQRIGKGEKMYPPGRDKAPVDAGDPDAETSWRAEWDEAEAAFLSEFTLGKAFDNTLDDMPDAAILGRAAEIWSESRGADFPMDAETAVVKALDEEYERVLEDLAVQDMDAEYGEKFDIFDPEWLARLDERIAERRNADGARGAGRTGEAGNARAGREAGPDDARSGTDAVDPIRLAELTPEQRAPFSDPDGPAAKQQADSLVHDMRADNGFYTASEIGEITTVSLPSKKKGWKGAPDAEVSVGRTPDGKWTYSLSYTLPDRGEGRPFTKRDVQFSREAALRKGIFELQVKIAQSYEDDAAMIAAKNRIAKWAKDEMSKAQEATEAVTPAADIPQLGVAPPADGMIRVYHGGERASAGEWVSSSREYAQGYAERSGEDGAMWYVDLPKTDPRFDSIAENDYKTTANFKLTAEEIAQARLLDEPAPSLDNGAQVDPAIAARQRDEAQLLAEAPLRGANRTGQAQDGTMGLGLFDAADQPEFLLDADGPGTTAADLLADLDKGEADLKTIRDCL